MSVLRERVTWVWLGLMLATCATTWGLSKDLFSPAVAVVGNFLIAAVKVTVRDAGLHGAAIRTDPGACRLRGLARGRSGDDPGLLVRHSRPYVIDAGPAGDGHEESCPEEESKVSSFGGSVERSGRRR